MFVTGLGTTGASSGLASISLPSQPRTAFIGRLHPNPAWLTALGPARIGSPVPAVLSRDGSDAGVLLVMWELPDAGLAYARLRPGDGGLVP